jgi:uncharacterized membrane protein YedE/YeeE
LAQFVGGFLVGVGTRIGNGCTTGHGICGIGRLSPRGLVATCVFTGVGMATSYCISPLRSWSDSTDGLRRDDFSAVSPLLSFLVLAGIAAAAMLSPTSLQSEKHLKKKLGAFASGIVLAAGLGISGMSKMSKVHDFLCLSGFSQDTYDPTLIVVMGSGILTSWIGYQFVPGRSQTMPEDKCLPCPLNGASDWSSVPSSTTIDTELLAGALLFGVGWGLTGICPGPALYSAAAGVVDVVVAWLPGFCLGSLAGTQIKSKTVAKDKTQ